MKPIDLSKVQSASPAFKPRMPNGAYQVRIVEVKRNPMTIEVTFAATAGDHAGATIKHWFNLSYDFSLAHLKLLCEAISTNGKAPDSLEAQHLEYMQGKDLIIRTIIEKSSKGDWPKIQDFLADTKENFEKAAADAEVGPEFIVKKEKEAPQPPAYSAADTGEW